MKLGSLAYHNFNVLIIGAGPAGAVLALRLRQFRPDLSILLVEKSNFQKQRIGETLHAEANKLLHSLGLWETFQGQGHVPMPETSAVWGSEERYEHENIFGTSGKSWHLDRNHFDEFLANKAETQGAILLKETKVLSWEKKELGYTFELENCNAKFQVAADFVVDASGRKSYFATQVGVSKIRLDNLTGVFRFYQFEKNAALQDGTTLVETWENGWWYSALLPDGRLVVACMSDGDVLKNYGVGTEDGWSALLAQSKHTLKRVESAQSHSAMSIWPAASQCLDRVIGDRWMAIGDAASTFDPLSSQGIYKAIRSGIFGAYAIADFFAGKPEGLTKFETFIREEYDTYLEQWLHHYNEEQRWKNQTFWKRRHKKITLSPFQKITANHLKPVGKTNYFLSDRETQTILELCLKPAPAHEILQGFKSRHYGYKRDLRLILGMQYLLQKELLFLK